MLQREGHSMRSGRSRERTSRIVLAFAIVGAALLALSVVREGLIDLPDWFGGGESDPAPRGSVTYEGQTARSASEEFLIDVGDGEATIAVQAKQDWDTPGSILGGDFQSTNGTSSVADPDDRDVPARLKVSVDYCVDGVITTREELDPETEQVDRTIRLEMGDLFVCDTTLEHTPENDSAFKQDDTPNEFHGHFVSFVARAAEVTAAGAECPRDELDHYRSREFRNYMAARLAERFGLPEGNVEVVVGQIGESSQETKDELRQALEGFANAEDPDDPDRTFEALDIQYLSADGEAVEDSCYRDAGETSLDDIESVDPPDPDELLAGSGPPALAPVWVRRPAPPPPAGG
jgi:hypothetical protein